MFKTLLKITFFISILLLSTTVTIFATEETKPNINNTDVKSTQLLLLTDNNPPYSYTNNDGIIVGTLVDKLTAVLEKTDIPYQFQYTPWQRALSDTKSKSNTLIYPLSRTSEREEHYKWVIPLHHLKFKIYGLKGSFNEDLVDISSGKYTFVCTENTILCSVLRNAGVPENSIIKYPYVTHQQMINMVFRKRVNFVLISDEGVDYYPSNMSYDKSLLVPLKNYNYNVMEYLAGNLDFDPALIKKIQAAFKSVPTE